MTGLEEWLEVVEDKVKTGGLVEIQKRPIKRETSDFTLLAGIPRKR